MKLEVVKIRLTLAFPNEETREQKARGKERGFHRVSVDVSCDTLVASADITCPEEPPFDTLL